MARPREFDTDKAVAGAMDVFWTHGYEDASLPDILEGMGITRGSLYKAFTDKKTLFMLVMEKYEEEAVKPALAILNDPEIEDGFDRIEQVLHASVEAVRKGDNRGCLLCSAAAGPASKDAEIAEAVHKLLDRMKDGFEAALKQSKQMRSEKPKQRTQLAELLITQYVGLRILARSHAPVELIENSVRSMMDLLNIKNRKRS